MSCCGLYVDGPDSHPVAIPLKKVNASVSLIDCLASVTLSQTYVNEGSLPVEAIYKFPVYESAAVFAFEAEVDGSVVKGVCKEREQAAKEYVEAVEQGDRAFLLEEQKADIFQISVGNIPPSKPVLIRISYIHELRTDEENDEARFTIPTTIASKTYGTFTPPAGTNLLPGGTTYAASVDYTLSVSIDIQMASGPVTEVSSPSHPIKIAVDAANPKRATAKLALETVYLDKDFILVVKSPGLDKPRCVVERDPTTGTKCCMVTFVPKFKLKEARTEVIFVLDRSGSMEGENITYARSALQLFLKSLPATCKFNIIGFGSEFQKLFLTPQPYNDANLATAVHHAQTVHADLGGTEILEPLKAACATPLEEGWQRSIIVLTDGEVYSPDAIFAFASSTSRSQNTRFFTLGVGSSVSHLLVNGLARAGMGSAEFVGAGERMEGKVVKLVKAGVRGFVKDYKVTWLPESTVAKANEAKTSSVKPDTGSSSSGAPPAYTEEPAAGSFFDEALTDDSLSTPKSIPSGTPLLQQAPYTAPPLYGGARYICYAILDGSLPDPTSITIAGVSPDGPLQLSVPVSDNAFTVQEGKSASVHVMAAKRLVQDIEEGTSWLHAAGVVPDETRVRKEVVRLSVAYGIASKYTSFVAVQVVGTEEKATGRPQRVVVPTLPESNSMPMRPNYVTGAMPALAAPPPPAYITSVMADMQANIQSVLSRGEKVEMLEEKTQSLASSSASFAKAKKKSSAGIKFPSIPSLGSLFGGSAAPKPSKPSAPAAPAPLAPMMQQAPPPARYSMPAPSVAPVSSSYGSQAYAPAPMASGPPPPPAPPPFVVSAEPPLLGYDGLPPPPPAPGGMQPPAEFRRMSQPLAEQTVLADLDESEAGYVAPQRYMKEEESVKLPESSITAPEEILQLLVSIQSFNGSFPADERLFKISKASASPPAGRTREEWATAVATVIMERLLKDLKDEWELIRDKAIEWLDAAVGQKERQKLVDLARTQISA
ncbi:VIT-domain-containing protein [Gonapodya prolifera JEL478]|uniref:VIT-domain-containing protein n=1 Tax=Gonapodya prolifera (strain JEL478) TaxID=1344416 RepID=A0A139ARB7_GONPJ|nr:VIT-domain-containing protein [Gonapodya prolifera JEL478]|eukprot:KXS19291.1 VIT-domain-containing protein [Gonapodya prolifera JEL478]